MPRQIAAFLSLWLLLLSSAALAEPTADIEQAKTYKKNGLSFSYPGNWSITGDEVGPDARYLFVESEGGAIAVIFIFNPKERRSLLQIAQEYSKATAEATPLMTLQSVGFKDVPQESGQRLRESVRATFFGQVEPHLREYLSLDGTPRKTVVVSQIAVEDLAEARPGFRLIETSLRLEVE